MFVEPVEEDEITSIIKSLKVSSAGWNSISTCVVKTTYDAFLTHWGRVPHVCVSKVFIIGSHNGLSSGRRQAIIWTNAEILLIEPSGTNFSETSIETHISSFMKMRLQMSSGKRRPFCLGLNVLTSLTHVMNLSVTTGVFPNGLKVARVIPIFKSGDASSFPNYRPVSVLPLFSKKLERLMFKRLISLVNEYGLLYQHQFGFRTDHSPNLALIYLVDNVSQDKNS